MRPVVMTCIVACVGLLPAAVSTGIGSQVQKPLALVVVGGILLAPFLILIVLPVLIELFSRRERGRGAGVSRCRSRRNDHARAARLRLVSPWPQRCSPAARSAPTSSGRRRRRSRAIRAEPLPAETASADVAGGAAQRFVQGLDIPGQWWALFHSEALNTLVDEALKANPDLQAAQAALRVAQENVAAQQGFYYPSVSGNFSASRQKNPTAVLAPTLSSGSPYFNLYTPQLSVSYVPDVFGVNRRHGRGAGRRRRRRSATSSRRPT